MQRFGTTFVCLAGVLHGRRVHDLESPRREDGFRQAFATSLLSMTSAARQQPSSQALLNGGRANPSQRASSLSMVSDGVHRVKMYGYPATGRLRHDVESGVQLISDYAIETDGVLTQWYIYTHCAGSIVLQVWRPLNSLNYSLVGSIYHDASEGFDRIDANILVQAGDVLGWYANGVQPIVFSNGGNRVRRAYGCNNESSMASLDPQGIPHRHGWERSYSIQASIRETSADTAKNQDEAFGASHTSFYTDAVKKEKYDTLDEVLAEKLADKDLLQLVRTMFDGVAKITEILRKELVTVADDQSSVFGDVQLGVDVLADNLLWGICKRDSLIKEAASEEEPEVREMHADGKFSICWDPLDGSSIVDNDWAVGTIIGVWPASTGILGATGRDQVTSIVANYGPRTIAFVALDDGVYEFTYGANGYNGWLCSKERIKVKPDSKIFSPANLRAAQEVSGYNDLMHYWMRNKYTLRYTGGLVPDIAQQFTKGMGIFTNPTSKESPAKLRLAFEAAPFGLLVEKAGGKTSNGVDGESILDTKIVGIDQRTPLAIGSANEVHRFNEMMLGIRN